MVIAEKIQTTNDIYNENLKIYTFKHMSDEGSISGCEETTTTTVEKLIELTHRYRPFWLGCLKWGSSGILWLY